MVGKILAYTLANARDISACGTSTQIHTSIPRDSHVHLRPTRERERMDA